MQDFPTVTEVVALALIDPDGRVLVQQRRVDRAHGGLWEFPGGKVEVGETAIAALLREIDEELGLVLAGGTLIYLDRAADPQTGLVISLYTCRDWVGTPACLDAAALHWCAADDLAALPMPPLDVPLAASLRASLKEAK